MQTWTLRKLLVCAFGALLIVVSTATAIRCYECNSHKRKEASCKDQLPDKKLIVDCSEKKDGAKYDRCRTIKQWVDFNVESLAPNARVIRKCGWNQTNEKPCYYKAGFGGRQQVCTCTVSECNDATSYSRLTAMTACLAAAMVAICLLRHNLW